VESRDGEVDDVAGIDANRVGYHVMVLRIARLRGVEPGAERDGDDPPLGAVAVAALVGMGGQQDTGGCGEQNDR
jgi:hypothetical protein